VAEVPRVEAGKVQVQAAARCRALKFRQAATLFRFGERVAAMTTAQHSDLLIMGGGLAGLSLAIQLRRELPALSVRVLERNRHPVPEAAFKVGESTVEIGAHYFDTVLGLKQHLDECQIR
jgi:NADPH-dependent 2,4-dienoyl-CoA reductase/sulfur reductase-like enzyme